MMAAGYARRVAGAGVDLQGLLIAAPSLASSSRWSAAAVRGSTNTGGMSPAARLWPLGIFDTVSRPETSHSDTSSARFAGGW